MIIMKISSNGVKLFNVYNCLSFQPYFLETKIMFSNGAANFALLSQSYLFLSNNNENLKLSNLSFLLSTNICMWSTFCNVCSNLGKIY